ncbi:MAG: hypothetical protein DHS20C18_10480 [Saprospiraceae bacterium]|nr:MAG: hypothetical protein DHS20C18_10480 [Saprospiraceae bacterium]
MAQHDHQHNTDQNHKTAACCAKTPADMPTCADLPKTSVKMADMQIPDVYLLDQQGETVRFYDLIKGKVVAMNFIFTTCTTICPPMGANLTQLKSIMAEEVQQGDLVLLSISIDPVTDTPQRLLAWSEKFEAGPGWTLLTGDKSRVDELLKGLNVYAPLREEHAPIMLIGKEGTDKWIRANGLAPAEQLATHIRPLLLPSKPVNVDYTAEENYFTNVKLVNQYGEEMSLFEDLLKDKVVVINPYFLSCTGSCPIMNGMMKDLQHYFGDKVGKDIHLISISVDPEHDSPEKVKAYAESMGAKRGWYLLTGSRENIDQALWKLGNQSPRPEDHKNILMVGNLPTRLWKKANGLAPITEIVKIVESVLYDEG